MFAFGYELATGVNFKKKNKRNFQTNEILFKTLVLTVDKIWGISRKKQKKQRKKHG